MLFIILLSGCSATIDSIEEYTPVPLERSDFMPTKEEIKSGKTKVVLTRIDDKHFKLAQRANLGQSLYIELERELSASGTVEILDRQIAEKFEDEIRLSELSEVSQTDEIELSVAKYAISGSLSNAQFTSRFVQTQRWVDKEGRTLIIPAHYNYQAYVSGILKIYSIPSMKVLKTIEFSDYTRRSEDSSYYGDSYYPADVSGMLNRAGRSAIHSTRHEFKNFLAPKGYVMEQRTDGSTSIVRVSIGSLDGLKTGEKVQIFTSESTINPLTEEEEIQDIKIADGIVSNKLDEHRAWIIIDESTRAIKLGDYIKARYSKEFFDYFNDIAKAYNNIAQ